MVHHQTETSAVKSKDDNLFRPLYSDGKEVAAVNTLVNLAEEAKLTSAEVNAPGQTILSICKSLIAGGIAGGVSRSAVAPLERLKILLQVQNPLNPQYNGMVQGLHHIWSTEGIRGFFKGNGTNCARIVPNSAVKFYSYEQASSAILWLYRRQTGNGEILRYFVSVIDYWMYNLNLNILLIPYVGLNFAVYETLKEWVMKNKPLGLAEDSELNVVTKLACGAAAGTVGQTVAYPLDVIRRRMQMSGWKDAASVVTGDGRKKAPVHYSGMVDAFRQTVRNEGIGALYKGLVPNSVKVVPSIALAFVTYEVTKDLMGVEFKISD